MKMREGRRLALQSTAEIWRGLDILDMELRSGQFASARETLAMLRGVVRVADAAMVAAFRDCGYNGPAAQLDGDR